MRRKAVMAKRFDSMKVDAARLSCHKELRELAALLRRRDSVSYSAGAESDLF